MQFSGEGIQPWRQSTAWRWPSVPLMAAPKAASRGCCCGSPAAVLLVKGVPYVVDVGYGITLQLNRAKVPLKRLSSASCRARMIADAASWIFQGRGPGCTHA